MVRNCWKFSKHVLFYLESIYLTQLFSLTYLLLKNLVASCYNRISFNSLDYRVRNFRGRVTNFIQSEARTHCFLASDWLKFETLPRKFRTLLGYEILFISPVIMIEIMAVSHLNHQA